MIKECDYCKKEFYAKSKKHRFLEHIYPVDKGGSDKIFNLVTACEQCNLEKSASLLPDEVIIELWNIIEQRNKTRLKTRTCHELEKYFTNYSNAYRKI